MAPIQETMSFAVLKFVPSTCWLLSLEHTVLPAIFAQDDGKEERGSFASRFLTRNASLLMGPQNDVEEMPV